MTENTEKSFGVILDVFLPILFMENPSVTFVFFQLRWPKQVRFCTGISANLVQVICPIYVLFLTTKFDYSVFLPDYPQKCMIFLQKSSHIFFHFTHFSVKCSIFWEFSGYKTLLFCCCPLLVFLGKLKIPTFTPVVSEMLFKDNISLTVLRDLAIRDMDQRNSTQLHTTSGHLETSRKRIQSSNTLCASTREGFGMRGLEILTAALGSV